MDHNSGLIDGVLQKYGLPNWMGPYLYKYVRGSPAKAIKRAMSFIEVKRKKGEVTDKCIRLPNGLTIKMGSVVRLLSIFYYCESRISEIRAQWAVDWFNDGLPGYKEYLVEMADLNASRMRAIKNLIEGLNYKVGVPPEELVDVFRVISEIRNPYERLIALNVILRDAYAKPFGFIFYKVFYPVAAEFMRSFGKAFVDMGRENKWGMEESRRIISEGLVSNDGIISLAENILSMTCRSINAELPLADEADILTEAKLLRDISIAYPLYDLQGMGAKFDVEEEVKKIIKISGTKRG